MPAPGRVLASLLLCIGCLPGQCAAAEQSAGGVAAANSAASDGDDEVPECVEIADGGLPEKPCSGWAVRAPGCRAMTAQMCTQ